MRRAWDTLGGMSTTRLEAFSDGVLAIVITLLVLDIRVPDPHGSVPLATALGRQWPSFLAYVISFVTVGIIWINHHAMIRRLRAVDHTIMLLNLALLLSIGILPFTTGLMAAYVSQPAGQHLAAAVYGGSLLLMSVAFTAMQRHILFPKAHLLGAGLTELERRSIMRRGVVGLLPYMLATALAAVSAYATLAICGALALFYALPGTTADNAESRVEGA